MAMNDDVVTINTQSSTQWDGFRHYGRITYKLMTAGCKLTVLRLPKNKAVLSGAYSG